MKVYSSARNQRKTITLNQDLRNNLQSLSQMLMHQTSQSLELSPSLQSVDAEAEALSLARQFVGALGDPCRAMLLYPLVLDSPFSYVPDHLFTQTQLPSELHPLLSLYLHRGSDYRQLERQGRRLVDLFYHFVALEAPNLLAQWLSERKDKSLGQWFIDQCVAGFFEPIYSNKHSYTVFITHFLKEGLAYFFWAALAALRSSEPPTAEEFEMQRIRLKFIQKYGLNSL